MAQSTGNTGTSDVTYNVVSILFHALQGAETYDQFIQDAEQDGDQELARFFRDVQQENRQRADRAKQILARRFEQGGGQ
jgi:rubrerythrin